jgi:hypothetical protein
VKFHNFIFAKGLALDLSQGQTLADHALLVTDFRPKPMASAGAGGAFAFASAGGAVASANGVSSQAVWVVEKEDFDSHPFTVEIL